MNMWWSGDMRVQFIFQNNIFFTVEDEIEGKLQTKDIEVSCDDYYSYEVGDWYSIEN